MLALLEDIKNINKRPNYSSATHGRMNQTNRLA
jgi:hypothetical protein